MRHLIVHLKKEKNWLFWRKRQIGCKFKERGKLAVNSKKEANRLVIQRNGQSTSRDYSPSLSLSKNAAYGRHRISQPMRIVAQIQ